MLKTSGRTESKTWPGEGKVGVGGSSKVGCNESESRIDDGKIDSSKVGDNEVGKKVQKLPKYKNLSKSQKAIRLDFFIPGARLAFTKLR